MANSSLTKFQKIQILQDCLNAWNSADAQRVASFYCDDLDYRDNNATDGIFVKERFIRYLKILFRKWPKQRWSPTVILPHEDPDGFSINYTYGYENNDLKIEGFGMDRIQFRADKIALNHVYLNETKREQKK